MLVEDLKGGVLATLPDFQSSSASLTALPYSHFWGMTCMHQEHSQVDLMSEMYSLPVPV